MVNKTNIPKQVKTTDMPKPAVQAKKPPNDTGTISVQGFVRIFDPNSGKIYVEKRA